MGEGGGGGIGIGFCGFGHFLDWFFGFCTKKLQFFCFGDYCGFCSISLLVFGKNKIGFSELLFSFRKYS